MSAGRHADMGKGATAKVRVEAAFSGIHSSLSVVVKVCPVAETQHTPVFEAPSLQQVDNQSTDWPVTRPSTTTCRTLMFSTAWRLASTAQCICRGCISI